MVTRRERRHWELYYYQHRQVMEGGKENGIETWGNLRLYILSYHRKRIRLYGNILTS